MKSLFENWRKFVKEVHAGDKSDGEVQAKYRASFKHNVVEDKDDNKESPDGAIAKEGGALGFSKWEELTGMSREELEKYVEDNEHIKIHKHGDIIDAKGLSEDIELAEDVVIDEDKICQKGKNWAMEKYKKWSAYAAMGASKYCKDPNYGKGKKKKKKKNESLEEDCQDGYERVPGSTEFAPGSCREKGSAKKEGMEIEEGELKKWRDENWTQSDGTPCGDSKAQKNPKRCKPAAKWAGMSKGEKKADDAKKKAGGKKGKQFVSATKKGKVKGYSENMKITKSQLKEIVQEEISAVLNENKPGQVGRDNPVLYKANQIDHYVKLLQQAARSGNADHRASSIQAIKTLLTQLEGM
jgi:hypothetical protein